jgi:small conductance mechanosensitive channel
MMENLNENAVEWIYIYGAKLLGAIIVLAIGLQLIKWFSSRLLNIFENRNIDSTLRPFLRSLIITTLRILLIISVLAMVGIQMTSFIAILGAAGLAIGLALSGTLQNFAGGVIILLFKPFKAGDFITAQGYSGTVSEIQIFVTVLKTPDNKTIIIPNSELSNNSLTNFSVQPTRRVDWMFGIAYGDNYQSAKETILELIKADERILQTPEPFIALHELGSSSVNIVTRVWVNSNDYWGVYFDMNEKVYAIFPEKGLNIPFPQMDVHIHGNGGRKLTGNIEEELLKQ